MEHFDVVVLGAGAAGLMCAAAAGGRGRRVLLLDHADQVGAKILISGGGRCNFTNRDTLPERFFSAHPNFARAALRAYSQHDFVALVDKHRIPYHEKTLGQLFCDGSARAVVAMLLAECDAAGVEVRLRHRVTDLSRSDDFRVETNRGAFGAASLVLATGGLSIPKMGATGFAHDAARRFGLPVVTPRPALVPLLLGAEELDFAQPLSGISLDAVARCGRHAFRESVLFTHRGLSGPAILQASSPWREGEAITLDLLPGTDAAAFLLERKRLRPRAELRTVLGEVLPQRLAQALFPAADAPRPLAAIADKELRRVGLSLNAFRLAPSGSEGYGKAEVTLGGVDTAALSSRTMAARDVPGLFVVGEAVDVTGWLGGYNFQWAWSSGWSAGQAA